MKHGFDLRTLIPKYLQWRRSQNKSQMTICTNRGHLEQFCRWFEERGISHPGHVTPKNIAAYCSFLIFYRKSDGGGLTTSTRIQRLSVIRMFYRWLLKQKFILDDPTGDIVLPRCSPQLPKSILTPKEVDRILQQPNIRRPVGIRDRALLETLYSTGMRRSELANLKTSDLKLSSGIVFVRRGKGRKDRVVPIGEIASQWLKRYLSDARPILNKGDVKEILFLSYQGKPLTPDRITGITRFYCQASGVQKSGACHIFRHSMATGMLENGADIRYIQEILGHVHLRTTQIYTHVSIRSLKEIHRQTHPFERE
ncbi:site-specific tyrosine recombinase XerC [candidate division CSSED10-310 bacterium]|uniref:Site-specific tyrosine recombinase XerC n=1 Tax=candidate division CSSED10-310 bacterium TaxID=2855610 RepID=A0ABV6YZM5_UNCC1